MTDSLNQAQAALAQARQMSAETGVDDAAQLLVQLAIAGALISLAQDVGKIALLLRQRLKK